MAFILDILWFEALLINDHELIRKCEVSCSYKIDSNDAFSGHAEEVNLETHPQVQAGIMEASGCSRQISILLSTIKLVFWVSALRIFY